MSPTHLLAFGFAFVLQLLWISPLAQAQVSVQESDSSNTMKFLGQKWNSNFFSLISSETDRATGEGGRLSSYNFLTFSSYLNTKYRFALRLPFQYNTAGTDRFNGDKANSQELFLQDIILSAQNFNLLYLPWDMGLFWEGRFYLPTSQNSKKTGLITRYRNDFILNKVFSRYIDVEYRQQFSYFFQSKTAYANSFTDEYGFEVNVVSQTKQIELNQWIQVWGKFTPQTALGLRVATEDTYWNKSKAENKSKPGERLLTLGPSIRFPVNDSINMIFAYQDVVNRDQNADELGKFLSKNTQMTLLSFVRF